MQQHGPIPPLPRPTPYMVAPAPIGIGDCVVYRGYALKVWSILSLSVGLHPDQAPGLFFVLKGEGMSKNLYFIVPVGDVERPATLTA